jgi:hypothetical protein
MSVLAKVAFCDEAALAKLIACSNPPCAPSSAPAVSHRILPEGVMFHDRPGSERDHRTAPAPGNKWQRNDDPEQ